MVVAVLLMAPAIAVPMDPENRMAATMKATIELGKIFSARSVGLIYLSLQ
jgi:hypothetical protein